MIVRFFTFAACALLAMTTANMAIAEQCRVIYPNVPMRFKVRNEALVPDGGGTFLRQGQTFEAQEVSLKNGHFYRIVVTVASPINQRVAVYVNAVAVKCEDPNDPEHRGRAP